MATQHLCFHLLMSDGVIDVAEGCCGAVFRTRVCCDLTFAGGNFRDFAGR